LPTFLRECDKLARECAGEEVNYPRYLLRLAELEMIERERRTVERRIKEVRLPASEASTVFEFAAFASLNETLVLELTRSRYIARCEKIIELGNSGTGRTHVVLRLGLATCKSLAVGFGTAATLVDELQAPDEKRLLGLQRQLAGF
jgi:DNA replication protein DnaC